MKINDLTYQINGSIFEVSRTLSAGFLEKGISIRECADD